MEPKQKRLSPNDPGRVKAAGRTVSGSRVPPPAEPFPNGGPRRRQRPARSQKTAMTVAQRIVEEITRRGYPAGTRLPTEQEMLAEYEVGRGTLRESLRFLEMNGVITMKPGPGGGPIVAEPDARDLAGTLSLFLQLHRTSFASIVEVRRVLEPAIARLAAEHQDRALLQQVRDSVDLMEAEIEDETLFLQENERFHQAVAWASGNPVFALLMSSLHWITDASPLGVDYPVRRRQEVLRAHREIYEALAAGDAEAAASAMAHHVNQFNRYLNRFYPSVVGSPLRWSDVTQ